MHDIVTFSINNYYNININRMVSSRSFVLSYTQKDKSGVDKSEVTIEYMEEVGKELHGVCDEVLVSKYKLGSESTCYAFPPHSISIWQLLPLIIGF